MWSNVHWKVFGPDLNGRFGGLQGTGGLEAVILDAGGTTTGVINDQFGNGVATVSGGTVTWNATRVGAYGPLAGVQAQTLTDVSQVAAATAWRSHRIDPTGFYWLGARYYEPTSGRFLSADPAGHAASPSLYDYAGGDPVNQMDSDGRCADKIAQFMADPIGNAGLLNDIYNDVQAINDFNDPNSGGWVISPGMQGAFDAISANRGLKVGQMRINSVEEAREILSALGKPSGSADVFRAKMAIYALDDPEGYRRNLLRLEAVSLASSLIQAASMIGWRSGITGGFTAETVKTGYSGPLTTVLGSGADVAALSARDGFSTLVIANWKFLPSETVDAINTTWLNAAVQRGDAIWLQTDPAVHAQLMQQLGKRSRYLDLELPMLQQSGTPATVKY
jgi:RHS repeat-associated protein